LSLFHLLAIRATAAPWNGQAPRLGNLIAAVRAVEGRDAARRVPCDLGQRQRPESFLGFSSDVSHIH